MKNLILLAAICLFSTHIKADLQPSRDYKVDPKDMGLAYKDFFITTEDGVKLWAWQFDQPTKTAKKYIIISDDGKGNMADNIEIIGQFFSMGYSVIAYDYRGYGKSDNFDIKSDMFIYPQFVKDLKGVIGYARKNVGLNFDLYGIGYVGAGLSITVGANRVEIKKVIADSPFSNFEDTKKDLEKITGNDVMMPIVYDKMWLEPQYALEKADKLTKLLFIYGETDPYCTADRMKKLAKIQKEKIELYMVPGSDGSNNFEAAKNAYFERIKKFMALK